MTGRFTGHLEHRLLLQADEAFWAGSKDGEGMLKSLVTSETLAIERKGIDAYDAANYTRLLVTSNQAWVVPAGLDERRFAVFDVGNAHRQDHAYFAAMATELASGGYGALLHLLLTRRYTEASVRAVPQTRALVEQTIASLPPKEAWLLDLLQSGTVPGVIMPGGYARVSASALHDHYVEHAKRMGVAHRANETEFGIFIRKHLAIVKPLSGTWFLDPSGRRVKGRGYVLAPLVKCRRSFTERGRGARVQWSEATEWTTQA